MMDAAISKISANGQLVIPADIRRRLGIIEGTKFLIIEQGGTLVLKPLHDGVLEEEFASVLDRLHHAFQDAGLAKEEAEQEIRAHRAEQG